MNNQVKLIDENKLLESLKKELEFCVKEKFNERNTRFYLGRETALTDIIKQIETGKFTSDTPPVPTIKPGDKVRHKIHGEGEIIWSPESNSTFALMHVNDSNTELNVLIADLEVIK
ncbi:MAG: hypothetical protein AB2401_07605 [Bacillus sp. (in: firmicutes)]